MEVSSDMPATQPEGEPEFSKTFRVESKTIFVDIKENGSGHFLKIAERSNNKRRTVVLALSGLRDLRDALHEALEKFSSVEVCFST